QIHIDEGPFTIGTVGSQPQPVVARYGFTNIPEIGVLGPGALSGPGHINPEQFWMDAGLR
ncbi:MAG: hypothetical protein P1S60_17700, partial [Anaerolineae bacterium]|nr:hypothetical protein [Anaerolineae bacterium]